MNSLWQLHIYVTSDFHKFLVAAYYLFFQSFLTDDDNNNKVRLNRNNCNAIIGER